MHHANIHHKKAKAIIVVQDKVDWKSKGNYQRDREILYNDKKASPPISHSNPEHVCAK